MAAAIGSFLVEGPCLFAGDYFGSPPLSTK